MPCIQSLTRVSPPPGRKWDTRHYLPHGSQMVSSSRVSTPKPIVSVMRIDLRPSGRKRGPRAQALRTPKHYAHPSTALWPWSTYIPGEQSVEPPASHSVSSGMDQFSLYFTVAHSVSSAPIHRYPTHITYMPTPFSSVLPRYRLVVPAISASRVVSNRLPSPSGGCLPLNLELRANNLTTTIRRG